MTVLQKDFSISVHYFNGNRCCGISETGRIRNNLDRSDLVV
jgi:hypothetical protein